MAALKGSLVRFALLSQIATLAERSFPLLGHQDAFCAVVLHQALRCILALPRLQVSMCRGGGIGRRARLRGVYP